MPSAFGLVIIQPFLATATNTLPIGERGLTVETTGMAWFGFSIHRRYFFCQTQVVEGGCHSGESHDCHGAANQVLLIQETKRVIWMGPTHKWDQLIKGTNDKDYKHSFDKNQGPISKNNFWAKSWQVRNQDNKVLFCTLDDKNPFQKRNILKKSD